MNDEMDFDEKKLYEELYSLIGAKIRFQCDGYVQEGVIVTIKPRAKRVTLRNVYFVLPDKRIFSGTLKYRFKHLVNYEVVATAKELNPYPRFEYLENLLKDDKGGKKYSINDLFFDGCLSEESDVEEAEAKQIEEDEFKFEAPIHLEKKIPRDSVIINCFDLEWKQAVKHIGIQKVIGVSFHGYKVSRLGKLSWVCISTSWCVFLFDIEKLGVDAFNNGLKSIFEDMTIKKVIHDCRFPSDCLDHQFDTKLVNVFDTQVADFVVSMQCYNDKYKYEYVQSLNSCLRIHLDILPEFSYARDGYIQKHGEHDYFSQRPVKNALRYVLIKDSIYLLLLHETLAKKLLGPLHRNVERYLRVKAGATKQEIDTLGDEISSPDCIPPSLLMYGIQTVQFRKLQRKEPISLECKFQDSVTGKVIDVKKYPAIGGAKSKDSNNHCLGRDKKKSHKENCNNALVTEKQQKLPVLKNNRTFVFESRMMPSVRRSDEIYHKLVNNTHFRPEDAEMIINSKPTEAYMSKFTMRMPLECVAFSNSASADSVSMQETGLPGNSESSSTIASGIAENLTDYSDTWAKLRAAFNETCNVSQNASSKSSKIRFVPAGMAC